MQGPASPSMSHETEDAVASSPQPLHVLAARVGHSVPQLEPAPPMAFSWDSGDFALSTGSGRVYTFGDEAVKKMSLDEILHIWEVGMQSGCDLTVCRTSELVVHTCISGPWLPRKKGIHGAEATASSDMR